MALVHRDRQRPDLGLVGDGERRVSHGTVDLAAHHRHRHVTRPLVRHIGARDAEGGVQARVGSVVGGVQARAAKIHLARLFFRRRDKLGEGLVRAGHRYHQNVGRVMEPEHRGDVGRLVLHLAFDRLEHDVRQVDAHHVQPVARQAVDLRPHQAAASPGLVLDDGVDRRAFLLEHHLLMARRQIGLAARWKSLPVQQVFFGTSRRQASGSGLCEDRSGRRQQAQHAQPFSETDLHH